MNPRIFTILLFVVLFCACNPIYYTANAHNVPLITQKGETSLTLIGNGNQVEFQGSTGLTNNITVQANGGIFIPKDLENGNGGSGKFIEGGLSFVNIKRDNIVFETFGLVGTGTVENHFPSNEGSIHGSLDANAFRYGIQPIIGYKSKQLEAAFSTRVVRLKYSSVEGDLESGTTNLVADLEVNNSYLLVEPAVTFRAGMEKIKLQLQVGYSLNVTDMEFEQDNLFGTIGVGFRFK